MGDFVVIFILVDRKDIENKLNEYIYSIWKEGLFVFLKLRIYKINYKFELYISIELVFEFIKFLIV